MPTYEYRCKACGEQLEVVQSFTDDSLTICEACGGELRKLFGAPGIAFKGSGFYQTDSRGGSKPKESTEKVAEKTGADSSSGSGDKAGGSTGDGAAATKKKKKEPAAASTSTSSTTSASGS